MFNPLDPAHQSGSTKRAMLELSDLESDFKRRGAMKRYTMVLEPAAHPEARCKLVVEAADDGDAYDQASDHAAAELPYRCTIAIEKIQMIGDGASRWTSGSRDAQAPRAGNPHRMANFLRTKLAPTY